MTLGLAVALFVAGLLVSTGLTFLILLLLPHDHFVRNPSPAASWGPPWKLALLVLKNLAGLALVALGIVLSVPGVPGQGLLTLFAGLLLLDLPGKRRLELSILRRRLVRGPIDRLRTRFGRLPFRLPGDDSSPTGKIP
jgi:hypothetical protein